jgi:hypothetical protein
MGYMGENILRQIAELALHVLKHGDERAFLRVVLLNDLFNRFQLHRHLPPSVAPVPHLGDRHVPP